MDTHTPGNNDRGTKVNLIEADQNGLNNEIINIVNIFNEEQATTSKSPVMVRENKNDELEEDYTIRRAKNIVNSRKTKQELNHEKEKLYPRKDYSVLVYGDHMNEYMNDIHDRVKELERCVGIRNPILAKPIFDELNNVNLLKVSVNNYEDYTRLTGNWPQNAFRSGVKVEPIPPNLIIIIPGVDKELNIHENNAQIKDLDKHYGLVGVERIYYGEQKPTNRLKVHAKTIVEYIEVLERGIYLNITSKRHSVIPNINYARVCNKCGSLNHRERECVEIQKCLKCSSNQHGTQSCSNSQLKCINCSGPHVCNNEICQKLAEKTISMNEYTVEVLLGEGLIVKKSDIFTRKKTTKLRKQHR